MGMNPSVKENTNIRHYYYLVGQYFMKYIILFQIIPTTEPTSFFSLKWFPSTFSSTLITPFVKEMLQEQTYSDFGP